MPLAKMPSAGIEGVEPYNIRIEVDVAVGLPSFAVVGLADKAIDESKERVRSTLRNNGFDFPLSRVTVHLAPSEKPKSAVYFDLPIALSLLRADDQIHDFARLKNTVFIGGLTLDGSLQKVSGALILTEWAKNRGYKRIVLPSQNVAEASLIKDIEIVGLKTFNEVIGWLWEEFEPAKVAGEVATAVVDPTAWTQIQGQEKAKRAAIVAAAGGHNLLLNGPPGAGKTLIGKGIKAILPPLSDKELLEVVKIHGLAGEFNLKIERPFRSPHHSASAPSIIGGGTNPKPGEISLAHNGVLLLDEIPEFSRGVLEALRGPLEDGEINVARVNHQVRYPARFILVATMNPCPCGYYNTGVKECRCTAAQILQYQKKISGPILDRIDMALTMPAVPIEKLEKPDFDEKSFHLASKMVVDCRDKQLKRNGGKLNAHVSIRNLSDIFILEDKAKDLLKAACEKMAISGRSYHKIIKVAKTICDLRDGDKISTPDIAEALQYRISFEL